MHDDVIPFTGNPLDRLSGKRADSILLESRSNDPASLILPVFRMAPLLRGQVPELAAGLLSPGACALRPRDLTVFLGTRGERAYYACAIEDESCAERLGDFGSFFDLRAAAPFLPPADLAIASQAKAILEWHGRNRYCGRCGAETIPGDGGNKRDCPACKAEHFPRTDPAVIMLVTCKEKCLLARNVKWSADFFSTLAGFVEPGESLEEAVARELAEEVGVDARAVRYFASQPWPFPAALMLGFFAECENADLRLDPSEIAEAYWFTREEARALIEGRMEGRRGPSTVAIARFLVEAWIDGAA